jgi:hypothetical protein
VKSFTRFVAGSASVTPFLSSIGLGCYMAYRMIMNDLEKGGLARPGTPPEFPFETEEWIAFGVILLLVVVVQLGASLGFTLHAAQDRRLANLGKVLWIVGFFMIGMFALPLYFALFMLRDPPPERVADLQSHPTKERGP